MTCTFFGHRDCPEAVKSRLETAILRLVREEGVYGFLVGWEGAFDRMAESVLRRLQKEYPTIRYSVVLSRLPKEGSALPEETLFPEGMERVPPRFAIDRRNEWMLERSDYVITYVRRSVGGAAAYRGKAIRRGKTVIDL